MSTNPDIGRVVFDGGSAFSDFVRSPEFSGLIEQLYPALKPASSASTVLPVGTVVSFAGAESPDLWLLCDGHTLTDAEKAQYPALARMMTAVPDLKGRVVVGAGAGNGLTQRQLAQSGGHEQMQAHDHGGFSGYDNPRHSHGMPLGGAHRHALGVRFGADGDSSVRNGVREANAAADSAEGVRTTESSHSHTINDADINHRHTIASAGGGDSGNMQPFFVLNYIIKAG